MRTSILIVALFSLVLLAASAQAEERHVDDLEYAETAQPLFVKADRNGKCEEPPAFTTVSDGITWCRYCPEGFNYEASVEWCARCPEGKTFIPPYTRAQREWGVIGLCVDYR